MLTKLRAAAAEESGFTLVELLIVVAIMGVLAGVVVFSVAGVQDDSKTAACKTEAQTLRAAEEAYYAKNKNYASAALLLSDKFLSTTPTKVDVLTPASGTGSAYTLGWNATNCAGVTGTP